MWDGRGVRIYGTQGVFNNYPILYETTYSTI